MNMDDLSRFISAENLKKGLISRKDLISPDIQERAVSRVISMYRKLKKTEKPLEAGEWNEYYREKRRIYEIFDHGTLNECSEILSNFWRNELGAIVKEYAKFEQLSSGSHEYVERFSSNIVRNYHIWKKLFNYRSDVLKVPDVGNQWGYWIEGNLIVPKATRYHAGSVIITTLLSDFNTPKVVEIGGGYCGMAYFLLNSTNIKYVDIDIPETLLIGAYYILCSCPEKKIFLYGETDEDMETVIKKYDAVFVPPSILKQFPDNSLNLLVNTFSFSEIPYSILEEYLKESNRIVENYIWHNNMDREGVVNRGYERIPASKYPIDNRIWKRIYVNFDVFHGSEGDYKEYLYQKRRDVK